MCSYRYQLQKRGERLSNKEQGMEESLQNKKTPKTVLLYRFYQPSNGQIFEKDVQQIAKYDHQLSLKGHSPVSILTN